MKLITPNQNDLQELVQDIQKNEYERPKFDGQPTPEQFEKAWREQYEAELKTAEIVWHQMNWLEKQYNKQMKNAARHIITGYLMESERLRKEEYTADILHYFQSQLKRSSVRNTLKLHPCVETNTHLFVTDLAGTILDSQRNWISTAVVIHGSYFRSHLPKEKLQTLCYAQCRTKQETIPTGQASHINEFSLDDRNSNCFVDAGNQATKAVYRKELLQCNSYDEVAEWSKTSRQPETVDEIALEIERLQAKLNR